MPESMVKHHYPNESKRIRYLLRTYAEGSTQNDFLLRQYAKLIKERYEQLKLMEQHRN